ncbi:MAG: outer membrane beta-barrel protein [Bacteroidetes bacterium]|nr:outer membrane beta-barrel protein [Bacteroidota bacterium]MBU1677552.1 outer membrane beta-barrel protein [Bacteroidota bacterium]
MKNILILFLIFLFNSSFAQLSVSVSAGFDPKEISLYNQTAEDGDNAYWNSGITFGINCDYSLSEKLIISALFQYSQYNFDKYADSGFRIPEIIFVSANGEDSKLLRTSVEVKYFPFPQNRFKFFILSGLGVVIEDIGTIKTQFLNMIQGSNVTYTRDSEVKNKFVHSLGLGVRADIVSNLFIDVSGLYYSNYSERFQTFFGASLGYRIF